MDEPVETVGTREVMGRRLAYAFHDAGNPSLVIMCHGFRSSMIGPGRTFVRLARELAEREVSTFRFDQYGSGSSDGSFLDSSFNGWVDAICELVEVHAGDGYRVALLGQSMGGAAVTCAAARLGPKLAGVAAWSPGVNAMNRPAEGPDEVMEEGGQLVRYRFWHEAHAADIIGAFTRIAVPTAVWVATNDDYVSPEENALLAKAAQPQKNVHVLKDHVHSAWSAEQADSVLAETADFLVETLRA